MVGIITGRTVPAGYFLDFLTVKLKSISVGFVAFLLATPAMANTSAWNDAHRSDASCAVRMMALSVKAKEKAKASSDQDERSEHQFWSTVYNNAFLFFLGRLSQTFTVQEIADESRAQFEAISVQTSDEQYASNEDCLTRALQFEDNFISILSGEA